MNPPKRNYYGALGYFVGGHQLERFHLHQLQAPACSALNASDQLGGTLHTPRSPSRQRMRTHSPGNPQRAVEPKVKPSRKPEDIMACQCSQIARASPAHPLHGSRFQVRPSNLQFFMSLPGGLDGSQGLFQVGRVGSYLAKVDFSLAAALKLDHSLVKSAGLPRG